MSARFITTLADIAQLPDLISGPSLQGRREGRIAMVGRSNVGKSTLINALLGSQVARVSKQPGKTRAIHFYLWNEGRLIVADLPGYGFAKTSHTERDRWAKFVEAYLRGDPGLRGVLVLLDARHGPTPSDEEAIRFLMSEGFSLTAGAGPGTGASASRLGICQEGKFLTLVFSKADTLKTQSERSSRKKEAAQALTKMGYDFDKAFWVSSRTGDGLKQLVASLSLTGES